MAFQDCINRITRAAGRVLTDDELTDVITRVQREVASLAKEQGFASLENGLPEIAALPPGLIREAATKAAKEMIHEAQKKRQRVALTIIAHEKIKAEIAQHPSKSAGLQHALVDTMNQEQAIFKQYLSKLLDTLNATSPRFFGMIEDAKGLRDLVNEMSGKDTGNAAAKKGAKAWLEVADEMRLRFNRAGGDIGKLISWIMPQSHDMRLVKNFGQARWVDYVFDRIDRSKYVRDDGLAMDEGAIRAFLFKAWDTISTDGLSDMLPGQNKGSGARANRGSESRSIHFKDGDAWLDYHNKFSGRGVYDSIIGHVKRLATDIALVEKFGPNSKHQFQYHLDVVRKSGASGKRLSYLNNFYSHLDGTANQIVDPGVARFWQGVRNLGVAAWLPGAAISTITDFGNAALTAGFNRVPALRFSRNMIASLNPLDRSDIRLAQNAGLGLDTVLAGLNRWGGDSLGGGWTSKLAAATMRLSGQNALTEVTRRGYSTSMAATMGDLTLNDWHALHTQDKAQLTHYGITQADWELLQKVTPEDWGGDNNRVLTVSSIRQLSDLDIGKTGAAAARLRDSLSSRVLAMVLAETDYAVVTPNAKTRALMIGMAGKKGTGGGEFARMTWMFKSFPMAIIHTHLARGWGMKTVGGKAVYITAYFAASMLLGAVARQLKDVATGKEPQDMDTSAFWLAAAAQGGGLGIFGDFAFSDQSRFGRSITETAAGPVIGGLAPDIYDLTMGNIHQAGRGEDTHFAAEALKMVQRNTPLINLWYTRAILDRLVFQQMQEYLSPGYLARMRERARKDTGQEYWNQ